MTAHLSQRLRDLADDAPGALSSAGLWREGQRHRRRRRTVTAVVGCLVACAAALGVGGWRSVQVQPAAPSATGSGPMQIPDRLYNPSPWTPSTRTPGRLVAVLGSTRDRFPFGSDRNAIVGVAAGSQTYRFLELPGQDRSAPDVELSPDGRHVAYWIADTHGLQGLRGFAVLDVVTGQVERYEIDAADAPFGVSAQSLTWLDPDSLALVGALFRSRDPASETGRVRTYLFTLGDTSGYAVLSGRSPGLPRASVLDIPVTTQPHRVCAPTCPGLFAEMVASRLLRVFASDQHDTVSDVRLSAPAKSLAYDAGRGLVAATEGDIDASGPTAGRLVVGAVHHGRVRFTTVPGGRAYQQVLAWVDPSHVTTVRQTSHGLVYDLVDVRTGARRQLTSKPWYAFSVAQDALERPSTVPGIAPPRPWNPRWVALGVLLMLGGGAASVVVGRRPRVRH